MRIDEFRQVVKEKDQLHINDDYGIEKCWSKATEIFTESIDETIAFIDTECTASEFVWLSAIFEEITEKTQSKEFIDCLWRVANRFPEECEEFYIPASIKEAEEYLD